MEEMAVIGVFLIGAAILAVALGVTIEQAKDCKTQGYYVTDRTNLLRCNFEEIK